MTDIVDEIRCRRMPPGGTFELLDEAAAEIEDLRSLLRQAIPYIEHAADYGARSEVGWRLAEDIRHVLAAACDEKAQQSR